MDYSREGSRDRHFRKKQRERKRVSQRANGIHEDHERHIRSRIRSKLTPEEIEDIGNPVAVLSRIQKEPMRCFKPPTRLFVPHPKVQTDGHGFHLLELIGDPRVRSFLEGWGRTSEQNKVSEKQANRSKVWKNHPFLERLLGFLK